MKKIIKRNKENYTRIFKLENIPFKVSKAAKAAIKAELFALEKHYRLIEV